MRKIVPVIVVFILYSLCVQAKVGHEIRGGFSGKIIDSKTLMPIANVSVFVSDCKVGTNTNSEGLFSLTNIPEGKHIIEISHIGYVTISDLLVFAGEIKKDYSLVASVIENDAVVVTGVTGATQMKKVPFSVSVLKKEMLFQSASTNIIDALAKEPGVAVLGSGPAISKPVIRGLSSNRVLTIHDGVRQEGQQWGDEHGIEVDEASVNKIEILKGPASLIYGSDALAGVINIITHVPVPVNTIKSNVSSNYQSNNHLRSINASIGGNRNGFNWNAYSSNREAGDYHNKYDGFVYNSKFKEHNAGGYIGYNGSWGYSHLLVSNFNLKAGIIEGERNSLGQFIKQVRGGGVATATESDFKTTQPQFPYQHILHFKVASDNNIKLGNARVAFNIGFQRNQRQEYGNIDVPTEKTLYFDLRSITYSAQYHFAEINKWQLSIGVNGMRQENQNKGVEQLIPNYTLFDIGGFLFAQKSTDKFVWSGGIRYDTRSLHAKDLMDGVIIKGYGFNRSFSNISGSAGMTWQATKKFNMKLNIARGYRAPSIPELASNGAHEGTNRYEYGNESLRNETSLQLDGGIDFNTDHISFNVTSYVNQINHFIFYSKLERTAGGDSLVWVNGNYIPAFKFSQQKALLSGLEARLDIHPHPLDWLHIENSFSMVRGIFNQAIEGSKNIPFMPATRVLTELRGSFTQHTKRVHDFYMSFQIDNNFSQKKIFSAFNTETITPGYTLLHASMGVGIVNAKKSPVLHIAVSVTNLTNKAYQNHLSRLKYTAVNLATGRIGVFNMGRNFSVKVDVPINFNWGK